MPDLMIHSLMAPPLQQVAHAEDCPAVGNQKNIFPVPPACRQASARLSPPSGVTRNGSLLNQ
jgi:hypothetical protein